MVSTDIKKLTEGIRVRDLHLTILDSVEKANLNAQNHNDFFAEITKQLQRVIGSQFCYVVFPDKQLILSDTDFSDKELLIQIANDAIKAPKPIFINNTSTHKRLRKLKIKALLAFAVPKEKYVFILTNKARGFDNLDCFLLSLAVKSIKNLSPVMSLKEDLNLKQKEIETINNINTIKSTIKDVNVLVETILNEMLLIIPAEAAFFLMYDKEKQETSLKVAGKHSQSPFIRNNTQVINRIATQTLNRGELTKFTNLNQDIKSAICVPVLLMEGSLGAFCVLNSKNKEGFTKVDTIVLSTIGKHTGYAISEDIEKAEIKRVFQRYVAPEVIETMLQDKDKNFLKTDKKEITILFSDLRGFTSLSEKFPAEKVVQMLNEYLETMSQIILQHKGTIDKFMGDGIMAVFGAPIYYESHALRAIKVASDMQKAQERLSQKWLKQGIKIGLGIGISTGDVVVGNIGSQQRTDYTAIGDAVNVASRLCSLAKDGQTLVSERTYNDTRKVVAFSKATPLKLKGKSKPLAVYIVKGLKQGA